MSTTDSTAGRKIVLTAMIFAVAMTFIDQTIVSIAAPKIQAQLGLSDTGLQWAVNAYLLALAAFFAFGGRLADTIGQRRMVIIGVIVFAAASAMCGLTPKGGIAEAWIVTFRVIQGVGGALMYPAALAIVIDTYPAAQRGRALALFFGIAGGLTAVGPALGGYLTIWTWRAIFWVNVPVAIIALVLVVLSKPVTAHRPAPMDVRGAVLIAAAVGLSVFGFQQSAQWGWSNPLTEIAIAAGVILIVVFVFAERGLPSPLINITIFRDRAFRVENLILVIAMMVFVPVFFFASEYAQISLGESASKASLILLYFFAGFVVAAQIGGRMLDRVGAKRPVVIGTALACVGLALWAHRVTTLRIGPEIWFIVLSGSGMGLMLGQANTDALNRAPSTSYGEATGITQTVRNYAASLGLAILGTIQVTVLRDHVASSLIAQGDPATAAHHQAAKIAQLSSGKSGGAIPAFLEHDFAAATQEVLYVMAVFMALACAVALVGLRRGVATTPPPGAAPS
jgi:EmrB/QacA subfamily drug resistance transporter